MSADERNGPAATDVPGSTAPPRRRRRWPLVLAMLLLALVGLVAAAPSLLSGSVPGIAADGFAERFEGRLEIASARLGWTGEQRIEGVRLLDPEGGEVLRCSVRLPSLLDLALHRGKKLVPVALELSGAITADDAGTTNLDRALRARGAAEQEPPDEPEPSGESPLAGLEAEVTVAVKELSYSDARTRAPLAAGAPVALRDVSFEVSVRPGEPLRVRGQGELAGGKSSAPGRFSLEVASPDATHLAGALDADQTFEVDLKLDAQGLSTPLLEALSGNEGLVALAGPLLDLSIEARASRDAAGGPLVARADVHTGPELDARAHFAAEAVGEPPSEHALLPFAEAKLELQAQGIVGLARKLLPPESAAYLGLLGEDATASGTLAERGEDRRELAFSFASGPTRAELRGEIDHVRFRTAENGASLRLESLPDDVWAELAKSLPPDVRVTPRAPIAVAVSALEVPLGDSSRDPAALLPLVRAQARVEIAGLRYADAALSAAKKELSLSNASVELGLEPGAPLAVGLRADVDGGGSVSADVTVADPAAVLAGGELPPVDARASVKTFPTALVDAWAGQNGLLGDLLGPSLSLELDGKGLTPTRGQLDAVFESALSSATLSGRVEEGLVLSSPGQSASLQFSLTPLSSKRVAAGLLPLVANITPAQAGQRSSLVLEDFTLPLSSDLSRLSGKVKLDLGEVSYALLPVLQSLIRGGGEAKVSRLGPYELRIANGVVAYDKIPIKIGGRELAFRGSFDLTSQELALATDVPLAALGKDVNDLLEKNRGLLSPDLVVPIELHGTWKSPRIRVPSEFVKKLVEDAAKNTLKSKLFEKLGGKKDG